MQPQAIIDFIASVVVAVSITILRGTAGAPYVARAIFAGHAPAHRIVVGYRIVVVAATVAPGPVFGIPVVRAVARIIVQLPVIIVI